MPRYDADAYLLAISVGGTITHAAACEEKTPRLPHKRSRRSGTYDGQPSRR